MSATTPFRTVKAAKDYLVERIVAEAGRLGVSLSKVEREMLYFTEDGGLSKHMEQVNEAFDRECNEDEYEATIGSLVRSLESHNTAEEQEMWDDAVLKLCEGDHYLLILINGAAPPPKSMFSIPKSLQPWLPTANAPANRQPDDLVRLFVVALILFLAMLTAVIIAAMLRR